jgi:hypothetical protein
MSDKHACDAVYVARLPEETLVAKACSVDRTAAAVHWFRARRLCPARSCRLLRVLLAWLEPPGGVPTCVKMKPLFERPSW